MAAEWTPCALLKGSAARPYAVLVLDSPLNINALEVIIDSAQLLVCADGAANRFLELEHGFKKYRVPDAVVGDMDSILPATWAHYEGKGVTIVKDPDQYSTDFTKALKWLNEKWKHKGRHPELPLDVVVLGGLSGRVDQGFSQVHHLYLADNDNELLSGRIYLLSEQSLTFILSDGHNTISIEPGYFEENVGIIPILGRSYLTTKGLEWDVADWPTEFGGQVSTSNHIRASKLDISFRGPRPLFTLELARRFSSGHRT